MSEEKPYAQLMKERDFHCGMKINRLILLEKLPRGKYEHQRGVFLCDCGIKKEILVKFVLRNTTKSCGCYLIDKTKEISTTHGKKHWPEYSVWIGIKKRCHGTSSEDNYGGRGISVCDEWINSFEFFIRDMGRRPSSKFSIERKNVNGNYCPENCYWATIKEQALNKQSTKRYLFNGEMLPIMIICEKIGASYRRVQSRLRKGWNLEDALYKPLNSRGVKK